MHELERGDGVAALGADHRLGADALHARLGVHHVARGAARGHVGVAEEVALDHAGVEAAEEMLDMNAAGPIIGG